MQCTALHQTTVHCKPCTALHCTALYQTTGHCSPCIPLHFIRKLPGIGLNRIPKRFSPFLPTDREEASAWQRQYGQGEERDSWSYLGVVSRKREWGLLGRDKPEQKQRQVPGSGKKWMKSHLRQCFKLIFTFYFYIIFKKNLLLK